MKWIDEGSASHDYSRDNEAYKHSEFKDGETDDKNYIANIIAAVTAIITNVAAAAAAAAIVVAAAAAAAADVYVNTRSIKTALKGMCRAEQEVKMTYPLT